MKVKIRTFGGGDSEEIFDNVTTIQTGRSGTIVWVSTDGFGADLLVTIDSNNHVKQGGTTLWVQGPND